MATTFGDVASPGGGHRPMKRQLTLREATAALERLAVELADERERARRLEDELGEARRLEGLGRLAGGLAHDFSNILAVINGHCELMLKRMDVTDPSRMGAESIRKAAAWGLNLTQHMITTSRAAPAAPTSLEVNVVVATVVRALVPLLGDDIQVALEPDPDAGRVQANAGQLEQSLMNLLLNARDAMPSGGRLLVQTGTATLDQVPGGPGRPWSSASPTAAAAWIPRPSREPSSRTSRPSRLAGVRGWAWPRCSRSSPSTAATSTPAVSPAWDRPSPSICRGTMGNRQRRRPFRHRR